MLWIYYFICFAYCSFQLIRKYKDRYMPGALGISPGLDFVGIAILCWVLAPVDIILTGIRLGKNWYNDRW